MKISFSEMQSKLKALEREIQQTIDVYNHTNWDDDVKESYRLYVSRCNETADRIRMISDTLDNIEQVVCSIEESSEVKKCVSQIKASADAITV